MKKSLEQLLSEPMIYTLPAWTHDKETLTKILEAHPCIQFVSFGALDLRGNNTDEKIPISLFIEDMDSFLTAGVQTDGSSVMLHEIATLNNAKVDLRPDLSVNWFVDYNYEHLHEDTGLPIGTLRIPAFLEHNSKMVDSRSVLKRTVEHFEAEILALFKKHPELLNEFNIASFDDIEKVNLTAATELEFWVRTPQDKANEEKLSTSQILKEQYWKRTKGTVRTALEETIILMDKYGVGPEMGHKEVGGITAKVGLSGKLNHVMEQLEIDWKYDSAMQSADNELFMRELIDEVFELHGLQVTFQAKPIEGVAGSGEHTHMGVSLTLKNGKPVNIFAPKDMKKDFLSSVGWGALMGILKNYEVVNPFVTSTNDAFNRLKPGFEAPICIVGSVGHTTEVPARNRTVLIGLVRDENPLATRFELRAPNPTTNTYLCIAASYQAMLDGIKAAVESKLDSKQLEAEFSKEAGEEKFYLEKDRQYRSEHDVFDDYSEDERNKLFGIPPATVWENIVKFNNSEDKKEILVAGGVFTKEIINSYVLATVDQWEKELLGRIIVNNMKLVRSYKKLHDTENVTDLDVVTWEKVNSLRNHLMKDSLETKSLFTKIREAVEAKDYNLASKLQVEMSGKISTLKSLYATYRRNMIEEENGYDTVRLS
ncbi:glutamine synthetase [Serpentinicella alkaliphila]|uniref:glutamine synthetase n=1 Tax=Serpentinicella alkaliphila TaxID=1734049 RepID=A0A4R2TY69_9FIRM|nr:glutamine synthetase [Serpentinicella alkaliphila]QUH24620.1 glutamine synthetase [Serpentinicella alkaliphila]TCQ02619.1 glutamine synthetase [Serpentinicella alkaliphila]